MKSVTPPLTLALNHSQVDLLLSLLLSVSRRQSDAYLSYVNFTSNSSSRLEFEQVINELIAFKLVRMVNENGKSFVYFTADGLNYAILECDRNLSRVRPYLSALTLVPGAHYARLVTFGLAGNHYDEPHIDDDLMEQSINDGLYLLCKSTLLWENASSTNVVVGFGDYYLTTWYSLVSMMDASTYRALNDTLSSSVKAKMPVHFVADAPLFSNKPKDAAHFLQVLDIRYLDRRSSRFSLSHHSRMSFSALIDLFIVQNLEPERVPALVAQYEALSSVQSYSLGFYPWKRALDDLLMTEDDLVKLFLNADMWLSALVDGERVKWGALVLELLQMCRVKDRAELTGFFEQLAMHPETTRLLGLTPDFNLMRLGQQLLGHVIGGEQTMEKPNQWTLWAQGVEQLLTPHQVEGDERVAWVLEDCMVTPKVQRKGKKGWSRGRHITLQSLRYQYDHLLSESDQVLIAYFERNFYNWCDEIELSASSLALLARCDNVVNPNGQPISIVPEPSLLLVGERDGLLDLERFPQVDRSDTELLKERTPGIFTFDATPDKVKRFFTLSDTMPSVPAGYADKLVSLLGNHLDWYSPEEQKGNIDLGEWDERPHLWLNAVDGRLELSIEHQSQDGTIRVPSGRGERWLHQEGRVWFCRDLEQEQAQLVTMGQALGIDTKKSTHFVIEYQDISERLEVITSLDNVAVHWHASSKKMQSIREHDVDIQIRQQGDWFGLSGEVRLEGGLVLDLQRLLESRRSGYIDIQDQNLTLLVDEALRKQLNLLESVLNDDLAVNAKMAYPLQKLIETMSISSDQGWKALENEWSQPIAIETERLVALRDYQRVSVEWAIHLLTNGFGVCLADDMGLGKTLQALKVIEHFSLLGPSLVVCPKSVLLNWQQESERFAPQLSILDLESSSNRVDLLHQAKAGDVVLMSYGLVTRMAQELEVIEWQSVVLDEAQQIKNPNTQRAKILVNLNAERRMALSGTPVENHLVELWSLFSFLNPGLLGTLKQFKSKYAEAAKSEEDMLRLRALVSPFIMRRVKKEVLTELPEKTELVHYIELNSKERSAYEAVRQDSLKMRESGDTGSTIQLFAALTRLRQVCCDPSLVFDSMTETSSKLKEALHLVKEALEGGHKVLIFSQFVQLLKRFSVLLDEQKMAFSYLDGQSTTKKRQQAMSDFKQGKHDIFLISLKAGGAGLNLTEADTVIHLDPWWNPAVEDQASDRAYRMGQTNPVTVYRLVATNTVEEKIIELHAEKRDLADKVLSGQSQAAHLQPEVLLELLSH
jgi:superfamily II DNA or RNA helicase